MEVLRMNSDTNGIRLKTRKDILSVINHLQALHKSLDAKHFTCETFDLQNDYFNDTSFHYNSLYGNFHELHNNLLELNLDELTDYIENKEAVRNESE